MSRNTNNKNHIEKRKNEILGIFFITLGIISGISLLSSSAGMLGSFISRLYYYLLGYGAYTVPIIFVYLGIKFIKSEKIKFSLRSAGFFITIIAVISIINLTDRNFNNIEQAADSSGGIIGQSVSWFLFKLFGKTAAYTVLSIVLFTGILLWFDIFLDSLFAKIKKAFLFPLELSAKIKNKFLNEADSLKIFYYNTMNKIKNISQSRKKKEDNRQKNQINRDSLDITEDTSESSLESYNNSDVMEEENKIKPKKTLSKKKLIEDFDLTKDQSKNIKEKGEKRGNYNFPGISLLNSSGKKKIKLENKSKLLEETLASFGVNAKVINVNHGPTITRYEIQPATGVKVSKIVNLSDDIALALAARDVRIEAPIPGKAAVGIEVPHGKNVNVSFRDVIASNEFQNADAQLTLALGKGIDGETIVFDLSKMPHLLVAGATGSGKSVCINTMISSILYRSHPDEVKLLLVDPKKVELNTYRGLPHLLTPVVTDPKKAANVLKLVVDEMESRYELFSETGSRGIESYNKQCEIEEEKLPYIVVIIDELSDLMMAAPGEVEDNICRLAQMSRAAGIHLIIATQRPSVDVITGLIKANIPSRISFAVSSQTDSRTILDMGGAEKLLGKGDMLFAPVGIQKPLRIQGAFLTNEEINKITNFVKNQASADYKIETEDIKDVELSLDDEQDALYEEAVKLVVKYRASISMLQRRLHIGHSRAARLIDQMEEDGIVGPYAGSKPREVLIEEDDLDQIIEDNFNNI
ncbi:DNA translocase FtsK [Halanaerobium sp. MA284_MarDTE_T2]|uniref:DNA translocase FtsK n=1 Tax=Halanaerobium sp. MA284_MarDTE_T2 TaxID=2183913 RepID=UPI000DF2A4C5|nr:DNA translocase FtsK [Halanaerobium sp. MA284_MarDTE_T2]RCW51530.1 DNA translocase FtsK [Halanaerobium sp. MA284_MarDTE_T2]